MKAGCTHDQSLEEAPYVLRKRVKLTRDGLRYEWRFIAQLGVTPETDRWTDDLWKALHFDTYDEARNVAKASCLSTEVMIAHCHRCDDIIAGRY